MYWPPFSRMPGGIALDVAGIERRLVERRREQQHQPVVAAHQIFVDRRHGARGAGRVGGAGDHAPGLRDRIDAAFAVRGRAERRAVVEIGAAIPVAVPAVALQRLLQRRRVRRQSRARARVAALLGERREARQRGMQEPAEPDAFALAAFADPVHAVVPVAGAHQRQAVAPSGEAVVERRAQCSNKRGRSCRRPSAGRRRRARRRAAPALRETAPSRPARR